MSYDGPSIGELKAGLQLRIADLVRELLPSGRQDGEEWCCGSVDGEPGQSCRVNVGRTRAGLWADFATGEAGDVLDLVAACLFRGERSPAFAWARSWLGLDDRDPWRLAEKRKEIQAQRKKVDLDGAEREAKYRAAAQRIFYGAAPLVDSLAWDYLTQTRGIDLPSLSRLPRALRFASELWHRKTETRVPGLVAAITNGAGQFVGVHRHFLRRDDQGRAVKAFPGRDAKQSLGRYRDQGGYIRVWRGASGKPFNTPEPGEWVAVTEGLEDALSVAVAMPHLRVACAVSSSNFHNIRWPEGIGGVFLCADNDGPDAQSQISYHKAVQAWQGQGLMVKISRPPPAFKDFNDMIRGQRCNGL